MSLRRLLYVAYPPLALVAIACGARTSVSEEVRGSLRDGGRDAISDGVSPDVRLVDASHDAREEVTQGTDANIDGPPVCTQGLETVVSRAEGALPVGPIALDNTNIYWTTDDSNEDQGEFVGDVVTAPKCGGTLVTLASGQKNPGPITVDDTSVYWTRSDGIFKTGKTGGKPIKLASGSPGVISASLAVDALNVYWVELYPGGPVMKVPIDGGTPMTLAGVMGQQPSGSIALDATSVYWGVTSITGCDCGPGCECGAVMSVPLDGGTPATLATSTGSVSGVAVDATNVYWGDGASISKVPLAGGASVTLANLSFPALVVTTDGIRVYWTMGVNDQAIRSVPVGGGETATLATAQIFAVGIALDATSVYWATSVLSEMGEGRIMRYTPK
jgi:hypothetical protein